MYRAVAIFVLLLLAACPARPPSRGATHLDFSSDLDSVIALIGDSGAYCSGVRIGEHVLTAAHCINSSRVFLRTRPGEPKPIGAVVVYHDAALDLAVLLPEEALNATSAILAPHSPPIGTRVIAVGHPGDVHYFISDGLSSGLRRGPNGNSWLYHSGPLGPGNSGGPLFDEHGHVCAINLAVMVTPGGHYLDHIVRAVPVETVVDVLDQL